MFIGGSDKFIFFSRVVFLVWDVSSRSKFLVIFLVLYSCSSISRISQTQHERCHTCRQAIAYLELLRGALKIFFISLRLLG